MNTTSPSSSPASAFPIPPSLPEELWDKIVYWRVKRVSAARNRRSWDFERLKLAYADDIERIDMDHPHIRKQNTYDRRILASLSERTKHKILGVLLHHVIGHTTDLSDHTCISDSVDYHLRLYGVQVSKEEKNLLLSKIVDYIKNSTISQLFDTLALPSSSFTSFQSLPMTLITSYLDVFQQLSYQDASIKDLFAKRIADMDVSLTIPYKADLKVAQTLAWIKSEHMITFCCPDYRYYTEGWNLVCDTSVVWSEIWNFGEIVIRSLKKTLGDISALWHLKTLSIIMPTYQIYLTPGEDYEVYCNKLLSTANKIKQELGTFCKTQWIPLDINIQLSKDLYTDETIYTHKSAIQKDVERDAKAFGDFYRKTLQIETNYGNDKFLDILVSDMAEWDLLTTCFDPNNTLYFLPEDEAMLRPQLVYMIQNKYSQKTDEKTSYRGLPTLILQAAEWEI